MAQMGFLPTLSPTRSPGAEQVLTVGFLSAVGEGGADTQSGDWKRWLGLRGGAGGQLGWRGRGARLRGESPCPLPPGLPGCQAGAEMSHSDRCPPEEPSVWRRWVTNRAWWIETEFALWLHKQPGHMF